MGKLNYYLLVVGVIHDQGIIRYSNCSLFNDAKQCFFSRHSHMISCIIPSTDRCKTLFLGYISHGIEIMVKNQLSILSVVHGTGITIGQIQSVLDRHFKCTWCSTGCCNRCWRPLWREWTRTRERARSLMMRIRYRQCRLNTVSR